MNEYVFLGYEKREYTNKDNKQVIGYNVFYCFTADGHTGYKPAMRFDSNRKSLQYQYVTQAQFERIGFANISPLSKVYITFNMYGSIEAIRAAK